MPSFWRSCALLLFLSHTSLPPAASAVQAQGSSFPNPAAFMAKVREAVLLDYELQSEFSYIENRRDIRVSRLGKVEVGPLRTFEVFPSPRPGRTYKRLIAIDGVPLTAEELARRDQEHLEHLARLAERKQHETPEERARRLRNEREDIEERNAIFDDALAVFAARFEAREIVDGQPVFRIALTPREDVEVKTREGRWMKEMIGRVWIAEADHQIVTLDLQARDDLTIGWGILGRVHEGSRFLFSRRLVDSVWLPAQVAVDASGRTLFFRKFDIDLVTTYSDYKRIP